MAKPRGPAKPKRIEFRLGYDSYEVEGETDKRLVFRFESPPIARAAFGQHLAKARRRKRLDPVDVTLTDGLPADRVQLAWTGDLVDRAWFTAAEGPGEHASRLGAQPVVAEARLAAELLAVALARPAFAQVHEIGIGLPQWQDSHKATLEPVLDVLAARRPALTALAFGDYDNRNGHILRAASPARIATLYPALERLRLSATELSANTLDRDWPALTSLALRWRRASTATEHWQWLFDGERTPALEHLAIVGHGALVTGLATSALLPRLRTLALYDVDDRAAKTLQTAAFAHVELVTPEPIDRYRDSRE